MKLWATIVDELPSRLWKSGNLYMPFNHRPFSYLPEVQHSPDTGFTFASGME
jgi:hypothetical protein